MARASRPTRPNRVSRLAYGRGCLLGLGPSSRGRCQTRVMRTTRRKRSRRSNLRAIRSIEPPRFSPATPVRGSRRSTPFCLPRTRARRRSLAQASDPQAARSHSPSGEASGMWTPVVASASGSAPVYDVSSPSSEEVHEPPGSRTSEASCSIISVTLGEVALGTSSRPGILPSLEGP